MTINNKSIDELRKTALELEENGDTEAAEKLTASADKLEEQLENLTKSAKGKKSKEPEETDPKTNEDDASANTEEAVKAAREEAQKVIAQERKITEHRELAQKLGQNPEVVMSVLANKPEDSDKSDEDYLADLGIVKSDKDFKSDTGIDKTETGGKNEEDTTFTDTQLKDPDFLEKHKEALGGMEETEKEKFVGDHLNYMQIHTDEGRSVAQAREHYAEEVSKNSKTESSE